MVCIQRLLKDGDKECDCQWRGDLLYKSDQWLQWIWATIFSSKTKTCREMSELMMLWISVLVDQTWGTVNALGSWMGGKIRSQASMPTRNWHHVTAPMHRRWWSYDRGCNFFSSPLTFPRYRRKKKKIEKKGLTHFPLNLNPAHISVIFIDMNSSQLCKLHQK